MCNHPCPSCGRSLVGPSIGLFLAVIIYWLFLLTAFTFPLIEAATKQSTAAADSQASQ